MGYVLCFSTPSQPTHSPPSQPTLSTYPLNTPSQCTLSTHPLTTLSTHLLNTPSQCTLINPHTLSTHLLTNFIHPFYHIMNILHHPSLPALSHREMEDAYFFADDDEDDQSDNNRQDHQHIHHQCTCTRFSTHLLSIPLYQHPSINTPSINTPSINTPLSTHPLSTHSLSTHSLSTHPTNPSHYPPPPFDNHSTDSNSSSGSFKEELSNDPSGSGLHHGSGLSGMPFTLSPRETGFSSYMVRLGLFELITFCQHTLLTHPVNIPC